MSPARRAPLYRRAYRCGVQNFLCSHSSPPLPRWRRAAWIQGLSNDFYQKQGKTRYQRTLELAATRGKILDRNGRMLATSLSARAIWAIPEDVHAATPASKMKALAALLG